MAAPTDVRVEALGQQVTAVYWTYGGTNSIIVYRSTDGIAYAAVNPNSGVLAGTTTFQDTLLVAGTKYWYKLTDDNGATFSSVVTVWTHICVTPADENSTLQLPRAEDVVGQDEFNVAMQKLEQMSKLLMATAPCDVCVDDGRITLDCSVGCSEFSVEVTEDINSISVIHCCSGTDGQICPNFGNVNFFIPPNTTRKICGWPVGLGFGGDECFRMSISGGSAGRTVGSGTGSNSGPSRSKPGPGGGSASGGGGGGGGCACVPGKNNALAITSCSGNNSLKCSSSKSLSLVACGGKLPYTWSATGSLNLSKTSGPSTIVTPPTNTGSAVAGDAYTKNVKGCVPSLAESTYVFSTFKCDDSQNGGVSGLAVVGDLVCNGGNITCASLPVCRGTNAEPGNCNCGAGNSPGTTGVAPATYCDPSAGSVCDIRTAPMIAAGCNPCGLQGGKTVTVTDADGVSFTIVLTA